MIIKIVILTTIFYLNSASCGARAEPDLLLIEQQFEAMVELIQETAAQIKEGVNNTVNLMRDLDRRFRMINWNNCKRSPLCRRTGRRR